MSTAALSVGLPLLLALLLLVSGTVKLRAGKRARLGTHLPSILEVVVGTFLGFLAVTASFTPPLGLWGSVGAAALAVGSSWHLGRHLADQRARRQRTEGHRLQAYVRHLADQDSGEAP
ncbi:MAG: hypothetical protein U5R14_14850 [Gemmatimonadota bacterium]|nr:hypothetical protein [Gemmatimonadota bacterium]